METHTLENQIKEALSDYLAGSNASRIRKALARLSGEQDKSDGEREVPAPIDFGDEPEDKPTSPEQKKELELSYAINFLNQNLKYGQLRKKIERDLKDSLATALGKSRTTTDLSKDKESEELRKKVSRETAKKVLDSINGAMSEYFPNSAEKFMAIRENLAPKVDNLCEYESKKYFKERCGDFGPKKKLIIRIKK